MRLGYSRGEGLGCGEMSSAFWYLLHKFRDRCFGDTRPIVRGGGKLWTRRFVLFARFEARPIRGSRACNGHELRSYLAFPSTFPINASSTVLGCTGRLLLATIISLSFYDIRYRVNRVNGYRRGFGAIWRLDYSNFSNASDRVE